MSNAWRSLKIGECLAAEFPGEWGSAPTDGGNATVLRATDIDDEGHVDLAAGARRAIPSTKLAAKKLQAGDILLEASGGGPGKPVGRVALFRDESDDAFICSNFFRTLRPSLQVVDPAFLAWRLQLLYSHPEIWVFQQQTTGIINLKFRDYARTELTLPPLAEQRRIAEILDTLDEAIRKTEDLIAKLKQVKQGLLHDLLTRGIDDNGELRDPNRHPEQFKDSPLGRIPKAWEASPLSAVLDSIDAGSSPSCPDRPAAGDEWGVLKVSAVRPAGFVATENKAIINTSHVDPAYEVRDGDLLITRANTYELVGLTCLVRNPPPHLLLCDKTLRLNTRVGTDRRFIVTSRATPS